MGFNVPTCVECGEYILYEYGVRSLAEKASWAIRGLYMLWEMKYDDLFG